MINIEIIDIILRSKRDELLHLESQRGNITDEDGNQVILLTAHAGETIDNQDEIDELNKEISYLKAMKARYEIARLLGLDNDNAYRSINYMGIEEEDITDFNLTDEQIATYNSLKSQIPREQLSRYKVRRELFNILGENNNSEFNKDDYVGIEEVNPSLVRYNLDLEQIRRFNELVDSLTDIDLDTTKPVNIKEEILRLIEEAYNKLNIEDLDEYNRIKESYLEKIDKLIEGLEENDKSNLFTNTVNYELASDLSNRYQNVPVKLNMRGVENLFNLLNSSELDEEEYNKYLEMLCANINELYQDEANRETIENLINRVDRSKYSFRNDLLERLSNIENNNLGLSDEELGRFVEFLNEHYNALSPTKKEKYYNLLKRKIDDNINNLDRAEFINGFILSITNKELSARIQKDFLQNDNIKFSNRHLSSYDSLVSETISKLESKMNEYRSKTTNNEVLNTYYQTKAKEIEKEIERLRSLEENYDDNVLIEKLNSEYNDKTTRLIELKKEVEELTRLKESLQSNFHKRIVDKKINNRNEKINKLRESKTRIVGDQKQIMIPKLYINQKKGMVGRHFESKKEVFEDYAHDYREMAEAERNLNGIFSGIKAAFYDFHAGLYGFRADFNNSICEMLNNRVRVRGNNRHLINREALNAIRANQQQLGGQTI